MREYKFIDLINQLPPNDELVNVMLEGCTFPFVASFNPNFGWRFYTQRADSKHLTNIFETNELEENSVISILETTATASITDYPFNIKILSWAFIPE